MRVDVVEAAGLDQRVPGGRTVTAAVRATKGPVPAPDRDGSDSAFGRIVGHADPAVKHEACKAVPAYQHVVDGLDQIAFSRQAAILLAQELFELDKERGNMELPRREPFACVPTPDHAFGSEDRIHAGDDVDRERCPAQASLLEGRATGGGPAGCLQDGPWFAACSVERVIAAIDVSLQDAGIPSELSLRMGAVRSRV